MEHKTGESVTSQKFPFYSLTSNKPLSSSNSNTNRQTGVSDALGRQDRGETTKPPSPILRNYQGGPDRRQTTRPPSPTQSELSESQGRQDIYI